MNYHNEEIVNVFEEAYTSDSKRLRRWLYAASISLKYYGKGIYERCWEPEDIVNEAVVRVLEGKRNYNRDAYRSFDDFMYQTINSIVEVMFRKRSCVISSDLFEERDEAGESVNLFEMIMCNGKDDIYRNYESAEKIEFCFKKLSEDREATSVFAEWGKGMKSSEIAKELGIEVASVESAKKRIRYRLTGKR